MNAWITEQIAHDQIADRQRDADHQRVSRRERGVNRRANRLASIGQLASWARVPALVIHGRAVGTSRRQPPSTMGCNA
jgi:hypothetical protein